MANAMPQALGAKKAFPGRQVISKADRKIELLGHGPERRVGGVLQPS
jgi:hypothetical protein